MLAPIAHMTYQDYANLATTVAQPTSKRRFLMVSITGNRRVRVLPYKQGSRGAKALATALGGKVLKLEGSKFVRRPSDLIINWVTAPRLLGLP